MSDFNYKPFELSSKYSWVNFYIGKLYKSKKNYEDSLDKLRKMERESFETKDITAHTFVITGITTAITKLTDLSPKVVSNTYQKIDAWYKHNRNITWKFLCVEEEIEENYSDCFDDFPDSVALKLHLKVRITTQEDYKKSSE